MMARFIFSKLFVEVVIGPGGTLFFSYVGLGQASTVYKTTSGISSTQKIFEIFAKKYPESVYLPKENTPKYNEISPKTCPILR